MAKAKFERTKPHVNIGMLPSGCSALSVKAFL